MTWEQHLWDLFEDLEQQAEGAALVARDAEVAELARMEYSEVDLAGRCHASVGRVVELAIRSRLVVRGRVARTGDGWLLVVAGDTTEWLVASNHVVGVRGLSEQAHPDAVRPVTARLGLGAVLRRLAEERAELVLLRSDQEQRRGRLRRVGKDFLELVSDDTVEVVPFGAVVAVRS